MSTQLNTTDKIVEDHLRKYLERTQSLWKIYNVAMNKWIEENPDHDGAPSEGAFPEVGITSFYRHGCGILIKCGAEIVEFDFISKCIKKDDYLDIKEIDIYWSFVHYKSLHPQSGLTEEAWNNAIINLDRAQVLTRFKWNRCAFPGYILKDVYI